MHLVLSKLRRFCASHVLVDVESLATLEKQRCVRLQARAQVRDMVSETWTQKLHVPVYELRASAMTPLGRAAVLCARENALYDACSLQESAYTLFSCPEVEGSEVRRAYFGLALGIWDGRHLAKPPASPAAKVRELPKGVVRF